MQSDNRHRPALALLPEALESRRMLSLVASMVKEIALGDSDPEQFVELNGRAYFGALDNNVTYQLWSTDGTAAGTRMVKLPADAEWADSNIVCNGSVYFPATDNRGTELWKSDGTSAGTGIVKDIYRGDGSGLGGSYPGMFTVFNGMVYFEANDGTTSGILGDRLWRSDGTAAGTVAVDGHDYNTPYSPSNMIVVNGTLYFQAYSVANGLEPWKSDGTQSGTDMIADTAPGYDSGYFWSPLAVDGTIYYFGGGASTGKELWKTDGTSGGTMLVKDVNPGADDSIDIESTLVAANGRAYFDANDGVHGWEVWTTDGTPQGTVMLKNICPDTTPTHRPAFLKSLNDKLFFMADDGVHGYELWTSDGTAAGTVMVKDINPGAKSSSSYASLPEVPSAIYDGKLYFAADDGVHGSELWVTDGTTAGTRLFADINPGKHGSGPQEMAVINGTLYMQASDDIHGSQPWKVADDTTAPTAVMKPVATPNLATDPRIIQVTYQDDSAVRAASIDVKDLVVMSGSVRATCKLVSLSTKTNDARIVATYKVYGPKGRWDTLKNATYTVWLASGQVSDIAGNYLGKTNLGAFRVGTKSRPVAFAPTAAWAAAPAGTIATPSSAGAQAHADRALDCLFNSDVPILG
jgi:ELWxxDGT repeat protein